MGPGTMYTDHRVVTKVHFEGKTREQESGSLWRARRARIDVTKSPNQISLNRISFALYGRATLLLSQPYWGPPPTPTVPEVPG